MAEKLRAADRRLLESVRSGLVSYSPNTRGGHLWQRFDRDSGTYRTVTTSRMQGLIFQQYVNKPTPRASGIARLTDSGAAVLEVEEAN